MIISTTLSIIAMPDKNHQKLKVHGKLKSNITLDLRKPIEPINRRVLGTCLMYPPFEKELINKVKPFLKDSSVRIWLHKWTDKDEMEKIMQFAYDCEIDEINVINPLVTMPQQTAEYYSSTNNNLPRNQMKPFYINNMMNFLCNKPHKSFPDGYPITGYEVLNEPQFPQNGSWKSDDYARYTLDISSTLRHILPTINIGVCLRNPFKYPDWNRDMLIKIVESDINSIDFAIHHPYDFNWIKARKTIGDYYARCAGLETYKKELQHDINLLQIIGHGRWRMALTEWNTHPPGYNPPTNVSRDLAVAVSMAAAIQMYWELGIDSANYFLLRDKYRNNIKPHFALINKNPEGILEYNPTYYVMKLYGEKCHGTRISTTCQSPTFDYPVSGENIKMPFIKATSIFDFDKNELKILLVNRHKDNAIPVSINTKNFMRTDDTATLEIITADRPDAEKAVIQKQNITLINNYSAPIELLIPPHSISALTIKGQRPLTERERVSKLLSPITKWNVLGIFEGKENTRHSLFTKLPCETLEDYNTGKKLCGFNGVEAKWYKLNTTPFGFVNFFEPYLIIGLDKDVQENLQGIALSYIWSPSKRECTFGLGSDYWGLVYLNDKIIINQEETIGGQPAPDKIRGKGILNHGWNKISVRIASGSGGMGFWLSVENPGDLIFSAEKKDTTSFPKHIELLPSDIMCINKWNNNHTTTKLEISGNPATKRIIFLKWQLQNIDNKNLNSAEIILNTSYKKSPGKIIAGPITQNWNTIELTNNLPVILTANASFSSEIKNNIISFKGDNITALIKRWSSEPEKNNGIWISASNSNGYAGFKDNKSFKLILKYH